MGEALRDVQRGARARRRARPRPTRVWVGESGPEVDDHVEDRAARAADELRLLVRRPSGSACLAACRRACCARCCTATTRLRARASANSSRHQVRAKNPRSSSWRSSSTRYAPSSSSGTNLTLAEPSTTLRQVNASAKRSGATASMPRRRIRPRNVSRSNQCLPRLGREVLLEQRELLARRSPAVSGTNTFGRAEVAVDLRDLVLEDQVVAERVPRQLAREPVILVEVVAGVREHELRVDARLQVLEDLLDLAADVRQEPVPEPVHLDPRRRRRPRGTPAALARASSPRSPGAASTTQSTSSSGFARASVSSVPPQPISMSSAWQPIARTRRERLGCRQAQHGCA